MNRAFSWVGAGVLVLAGLVASPACGGSEDRVSVTRGGSGGDGGAAGMGAGLGADVVVPPPPTASNLGAACRDDEDCSEGLRCITAASGEFDGAGPPGGYCTTECDSDAECQEYADAHCFEFGVYNPVYFCLLDCVPGADLTDGKCWGRLPGVACVPTEDPAVPGFCSPMCQSHAECGAGLYCDPYMSLCTSTEPTGDVLGSSCTVEATGLDNCQGMCLPLLGEDDEPVTQVCTQACSVGWGCGWDDPANDPADALCEPFSLDANYGDMGWCRQLCDCNDDCRNPDFSCLDVLDPADVTILHRLGLCAMTLDSSIADIPCDAGNAGAGGAAGGSSGAAAGAAGAGVGNAAGAGGAAGG
jgi:hypothetical protein